MSDFKPFANDTQSTTIGPDEGLTFENGQEQISVYGNFELNKNTDPAEIDQLIEFFQNIKSQLEVNNKVTTPVNKSKLTKQDK